VLVGNGFSIPTSDNSRVAPSGRPTFVTKAVWKIRTARDVNCKALTSKEVGALFSGEEDCRNYASIDATLSISRGNCQLLIKPIDEP
jgi:hypothetical protein